jgi:hypothetical protein
MLTDICTAANAEAAVLCVSPLVARRGGRGVRNRSFAVLLAPGRLGGMRPAHVSTVAAGRLMTLLLGGSCRGGPLARPRCRPQPQQGPGRDDGGHEKRRPHDGGKGQRRRAKGCAERIPKPQPVGQPRRISLGVHGVMVGLGGGLGGRADEPDRRLPLARRGPGRRKPVIALIPVRHR